MTKEEIEEFEKSGFNEKVVYDYIKNHFCIKDAAYINKITENQVQMILDSRVGQMMLRSYRLHVRRKYSGLMDNLADKLRDTLTSDKTIPMALAIKTLLDITGLSVGARQAKALAKRYQDTAASGDNSNYTELKEKWINEASQIKRNKFTQ